MTLEEEFASLSSQCKNFIRTGQIAMYSGTLKKMAGLFQRVDRFDDQLRVLVLSFYIDLSGFSRASYIDRNLVEQVRIAMQRGRICIDSLERLFYEWISSDMMPQHVLGQKDCWYLLRLCIEGKTEHAEYILTKI